MIRFSAAFVFAASIAAIVSPAAAQSRVEAGVLECAGTTASFVVGSVTELRGIFKAAGYDVGVGANALVGGSNNTIALQPLSLQGQTGLGVAAGVAGLELRPGR